MNTGSPLRCRTGLSFGTLATLVAADIGCRTGLHKMSVDDRLDRELDVLSELTRKFVTVTPRFATTCAWSKNCDPE
jgi:hypothetical protein